MMTHEDWLHSDQTAVLIRWLEKKKDEWVQQALNHARGPTPISAADYAGRAQAVRDILDKIREKEGKHEGQ